MKLQIRLETPDSSYATITIHFEFLMTILLNKLWQEGVTGS